MDQEFLAADLFDESIKSLEFRAFHKTSGLA